jgi:acetyl-CoA acetyltransferase
MGETAENVAQRWKISRIAQDELLSNPRLKFAAGCGKWDEMAVELIQDQRLAGYKDEYLQETSLRIVQTQTGFISDGIVTSNSAGLNDGAAAMLQPN